MKLGEHASEVAALRQIMGMGAMGRDHLIRALERETHPSRDRLLADREMDRAAHFLVGVTARDFLLDPAVAQHIAKQGFERCHDLSLALGRRAPAHRQIENGVEQDQMAQLDRAVII